MYLISIPARKSGELHTTPVSELTVEGQRYAVVGLTRPVDCLAISATVCVSARNRMILYTTGIAARKCPLSQPVLTSCHAGPTCTVLMTANFHQAAPGRRRHE